MNQFIDSKSRPALSVCIPLYNKVPVLERTLSSIEVQNLKDLDVVVVNNNSTDYPEDLLSKWSKRLSLRVFTLPHTISAFDNWLLALSLGTGKNLFLQLAGDELLPGALSLMLESLEHDNSIGFVHGRTLVGDIPERREFCEKTRLGYNKYTNEFRQRIVGQLSLAEKAEIYSSKKCENPFGSLALMLRAELLPLLRSGVNGFSSAFETFPDYEIWLRLFIFSQSKHLNYDVNRFYYGDHCDKSEAYLRRAFTLQIDKMGSLILIDPELAEFRKLLSPKFLSRLYTARLTSSFDDRVLVFYYAFLMVARGFLRLLKQKAREKCRLLLNRAKVGR